MAFIIGSTWKLWQVKNVDGLDAASSNQYSNYMTFTRIFPTLTQNSAYKRCLKGFREDNLGLPFWIPKPDVIIRGDETTGVGFIIRRCPLALQEGIVGYKSNTTKKSLTMFYKVLNPSYTTYPVKNHLGTIVFVPNKKGCTMTWTVEWTPSSPTWLVNIFVISTIKLVISRAADYVARGDPGPMMG